ncbi:MAG: hypothetical protein ACSW71_00215 [Methanobrevibacter sp.]
MANTISHDWASIAFPFDFAMLILLLTVVGLYAIQAYKERSLAGAAGNSITIL